MNPVSERFDVRSRSAGRLNNALVVKFGQIGDVIMAIPAVRALYERGYDIHWACGKAARPLLECYSWIHIIPVDDRAILRGSLLERVRNVAAFWSRAGFRRYDLCATLYYDRRFHILTRPIRARHKVALSKYQRSGLMLPGRHHTDEYLRILLGNEDQCRETSTSPVAPDRLPPFSWDKDRVSRRVVVFPGGASNVLGEQVLRRWPIENYAQLAGQLLDRGWEVAILGGPEDGWVQPHFQDLAVTDYVGKLSIPEVVQACSACDAVITHDTGPLHLAGLTQTCLVGIFGPTDPATRVPRRPYSVGIWGGQGFACRPCYDGRDFAPCTFNGCMRQVSPALVLRELDRVLAESQAGEPSPWRIVLPEIEADPSSAAVRLVSLGTQGLPEAENKVDREEP